MSNPNNYKTNQVREIREMWDDFASVKNWWVEDRYGRRRRLEIGSEVLILKLQTLGRVEEDDVWVLSEATVTEIRGGSWHRALLQVSVETDDGTVRLLRHHSDIVHIPWDGDLEWEEHHPL